VRVDEVLHPELAVIGGEMHGSLELPALGERQVEPGGRAAGVPQVRAHRAIDVRYLLGSQR